ncbi:MAG TPA: HYR domain-containing protein [Flavobacteriales bacterium]|nr:HYR domain-containing protein [Flavobacteriales bacterium]
MGTTSICLFLTGNVQAAPVPVFSASTSSAEIGNAIAIDSVNQFIYAVGKFRNSSTFPSIPSSQMNGGTNNGKDDGFLIKMNFSGVTQWVVNIGGNEDDEAVAISVGPDGNVYLTGYFYENARFYSVGGTFTSISEPGKKEQIFYASYDPAGMLRWTFSSGGNKFDEGLGITTNANGVFICGVYEKEAGAAIGGLPVESTYNKINTFLLKTNFNGVSQWMIEAKSDEDDYDDNFSPQYMKMDICAFENSVYVIGLMQGTNMRFTTPAGTLLASPILTNGGTNADIFTYAVNDAGVLTWAKNIRNTGSNNITGFAIAADCYGVYIAGTIHDNPVFPSTDPSSTMSTGDHDFAFIARLNKSTGIDAWVKRMGGGVDHEDIIYDLATDHHGYVYATGTLRSNPFGAPDTTISGALSKEVFIAKYRTDGVHVWTKACISSGDDMGYGIATYRNTKVFVTGEYSTNFNFGSVNVTTSASQNFFVSEFNAGSTNFYPCCTSPPVAGTASAASLNYCPGSPVTLYLTGSTGVIQWQVSIDGGTTWNNVAGANNDTLVYTPTGSSIKFRARLKTDLCGYVFSNIVTATYPTTTPVIAGCPASITVFNASGTCAQTVSWTTPTVSDVCPGSTIVQTSGPAPGSAFPIGVTSIAYTANNVSGLSSTCSFTVTVTDNELPVINNCPSTITVNTSAGLCSAVVTWVAPTASDNCPGATITQTSGLPSGSVFPKGTTNIVYTATDAAGNTTTCSFTVSVIDNQNPVIASCPAAIVTNTAAGLCSRVVTWTAPTVTDNCPGATITQTAGSPSGSAFPKGISTITYTATDAAGNTATCTFTITVNDNQNPVISGCPASITTNTSPGNCSANITWTAPTVSDNCPGATINQTAGLPSGSAFPKGISTITYTATDAAGNSSTCTFTVTVNDNELPVISSCPSPIAVNTTAGLCSAVVTWTLPTVSDNCAGATIIQTAGLPSGSAFPKGISTIVYTATDAVGNTTTCTFTVTVSDAQLPAIVGCPSSITVNASPGSCTAVVSWGPPSTTDNCPGATIVQTAGLPPGSAFPKGISTVTYTATDAVGNTNTCSFTITVVDNQLPVIVSCPSPIVTTTSTGLCSKVVAWTAPTVTDNCSGATIVQTAGAPSGSAFPKGVSTIIYTATDAAGNSTTCSFTITVNDNETPVISGCPLPITANTSPGNCSANITWTAPTVSDNCPGATIAQTTGLPSGSSFPKGTSTVTYTATDAAGNSSTCSFTITISDNEIPVFTSCPSNITLNNNAGLCTANATWAIPAATDNCTGTTVVQTAGLPPGSAFPIGLTTICYTATDASGNTTLCTFTVTVNDTENPVIVACPSNISVSNDSGNCSAIVTWIAPTQFDNCSGSTIVQTSGLTPGSAFPIGVSSVVYTATDASGNASLCSFTITVTDDETPFITGCPSDIVVSNAPGQCNSPVSWTAPTVNDNCSGSTITQTNGPAPGSVFPLGNTLISYQAIDASGNISVCDFTVTVNDSEAPQVFSCPGGVTGCDSLIFYFPPSANDNCSSVTVTQIDGTGYTSGDVFPTGTTHQEYTFTDSAGNFSTCAFDITVLPVIYPQFLSIVPDTFCFNSTLFDLSAFVTLNPGETSNFYSTSGLAISGDLLNPSLSLAGLYTIYHVVTNGYCSDTGTATIRILPEYNSDWSIGDTICEASGLITLNSLLSTSADTTGIWSGGPGLALPLFNPSGLGNINSSLMYVTGVSFCTDTTSHSFYVAPDVDPGWSFVTDTICSSVSPINLSILVTGTSSGVWNGSSISGNYFEPAGISGQQVVTYTVGMAQCKESLNDTIMVYLQPAPEAGQTLEICGFTTTLNAIPSVGSIDWSSLNALITDTTQASTSVTVSQQGIAVFCLSETNWNCVSTDTVSVLFWEAPVADAGPDQYLDFTTSSVMDAPDTVIGTGNWASISEATSFELASHPNSVVNNLHVGSNLCIWTVSNGVCPAVRDEVIIYVNDLFIPQGFSPNEDGINDVLEIKNIDKTENTLQVFNRWGQVVYEAVNYKNDWKGTDKNNYMLPDDTYYYIVTVPFFPAYTGYVILKQK